MTATGFCANCGTARGSGAFCGNCGAAYAPSRPSMAIAPEPDIARALIHVQNLGIKLVIGRLIGLALALLLWWYVVVPASGENILVLFVSLPVLAFAGIFAGGRATLELLAGR